MFPTGNLLDELDVPGVGTLEATMINAGIPTIFVDAARLGYNGTELQGDVNGDKRAAGAVRDSRARGAVRMGVAATLEEATAKRQHTPKSPSSRRQATSRPTASSRRGGRRSTCCARIFSMGKLHHAMMGTGAVAIGAAAAIPGTLVQSRGAGRARRPRCASAIRRARCASAPRSRRTAIAGA